MTDQYAVRKAERADVDALATLIAVSARSLSSGYYTVSQVEAALQGSFGVDTQLIDDNTFYVVEYRKTPGLPTVVACGGWSFRRTLFGSSTAPDRDMTSLDPNVDAARVRAFFVHPDHARRGLARQLLSRCEQAASAQGFRRLQLVATLPGVPFYESHGFVSAPAQAYSLPNGADILFVPMAKQLSSG